jgi:hypothetical protein
LSSENFELWFGNVKLNNIILSLTSNCTVTNHDTCLRYNSVMVLSVLLEP